MSQIENNGCGCLFLFVSVFALCFIFTAWNYPGLFPFAVDCLSLAVVSFWALRRIPKSKARSNLWWRRGLSAVIAASLALVTVMAFKLTWFEAALSRLRLNDDKLYHLGRWLSPFLVLPAGIIVLVAIVNFFRGTPKILKRAIAVRPPALKEGELSIVVGDPAPDLVPADVRELQPPQNPEAKIVLPASLLTRGISILGDPGSGKSRLMRQIHDQLWHLYPDVPILIHDPKGEWLRTYYNPECDLIFAPYDKRTVGWDIFSDLKKHPQLLSSIVATAVSQHHGRDSDNLFWIDSATAMIQEQLELSKDVNDFRGRLAQWRKDHADEKTSLSIFSSARQAIKDLATIDLVKGSGSPKMMDDFLKHKGRIFLLNSPTQSKEQGGPFAIFLSAFTLSCLSLPDTGTPRAAAIIDEALFFNLPRDVEQALTAQARSKGLIIVAGSQWIPREEKRLLTRAEFTFGMKVGDLATSKILSDHAGEAIYDERVTSQHSGREDSTTTSMQERARRLMPPELFRTLPNRGFILFHSAGMVPGWTPFVSGDQRENIPAFEYQAQPSVSEFMKIL
jgi:hypothetical protein